MTNQRKMKKNSEEKQIVKKDRDTAADLEALRNTSGGKLLIEILKKDIASVADELVREYRTLPHIEMISLCAKLSEKLKVLRLLNRAAKNKKFATEELERLLTEEPEE